MPWGCTVPWGRERVHRVQPGFRLCTLWSGRWLTIACHLVLCAAVGLGKDLSCPQALQPGSVFV